MEADTAKKDIRNGQFNKDTRAAQPYCPFSRNLGMSPVALMNNTNTTHVQGFHLLGMHGHSCRSKSLHESEPFVFAQPSMQSSLWSQEQVLLSAPGEAGRAVPFHRLAKEQSRSCLLHSRKSLHPCLPALLSSNQNICLTGGNTCKRHPCRVGRLAVALYHFIPFIYHVCGISFASRRFRRDLQTRNATNNTLGCLFPHTHQTGLVSYCLENALKYHLMLLIMQHL